MDSLDFHTRLPPRKRLLAGLKQKHPLSDCSLSLPIPLISKELYARLHKVLNSSSASVENIIEEVNSVALDAAEVATAVRANAVEKVESAAKAKVAAKKALELVDSIKDNNGRKFASAAKGKLKKRRVEVKHLYENDEEMARILQRTMNGSPRISNRSDIKQKLVSGKDLDRKKLDHLVSNQYHGSSFDVGKKAKFKRKKLLLSHFNINDKGKREEMLVSEDNAEPSDEPYITSNAGMQEVRDVSMPFR